MNQRVRLLMLCVMAASTVTSVAAQNAKLNSVLEIAEFVRDWQITKKFTMEVGQAKPAGYCGFKTTPEEMTF